MKSAFNSLFCLLLLVVASFAEENDISETTAASINAGPSPFTTAGPTFKPTTPPHGAMHSTTATHSSQTPAETASTKTMESSKPKPVSNLARGGRPTKRTRSVKEGNQNVMSALHRGSAEEINAAMDAVGAAAASDKGVSHTAMAASVMSGNLNALKTVHEKTSASVDAVGVSGNSALMWAAMRGQTEAVEYLLAQGADKTIVNKEGKNAERLALEKGHRALATFIRQYK